MLAAGGIDNARLLLLSDRTHPAGIGNDHDVVGRYFADHPSFVDAHITAHDPLLGSRLSAYDASEDNGTAVIRAISLDPELIAREQLMHSWTVVHPRVGARFRDAVTAAREVVSTLRSPGSITALPRAVARNASTLIRGVELMARAVATGTRSHHIPVGWSGRRPDGKLFERGELTLASCFEQAPNPDSRIALGTGVDRLGLRLPHLDYRWSEIDAQSARRSTEIIGKELATAGIGEVWWADGAEFPDRSKVSTAHHLIGTTRMHRDPRHGVVDENCRVHGISNLSIAGSSTFPTGGSANPTLTLVALAIRLADRIERELG